jgi:hypothetical protein
MMSLARLRTLAFRIKHDLACIDMDEAARSRLGDLISASKAFASVVHGGELHEHAQSSLAPQEQSLTIGERG